MPRPLESAGLPSPVLHLKLGDVSARVGMAHGFRLLRPTAEYLDPAYNVLLEETELDFFSLLVPAHNLILTDSLPSNVWSFRLMLGFFLRRLAALRLLKISQVPSTD